MEVDDRGDVDTRFEGVYLENRPFLVDLAFRMLGNIGDAEDMVQDAFARLLRTGIGQIDDLRGWLVVVVSRLCLDTLRSARTRRTSRPDEHTDALDQFESAGQAPDPADRVTLDENVRLALLVVLENLAPGERAVFVLHDVFRYPFETVASIVGRSPEACRKLASRARRRIEADAGPARFAVEPVEHRLVAQRFIAACAGGDLQALLSLLDAEVAGHVDLGEGVAPAPIQVGRRRVGSNLLTYFGGATGTTLVSQSFTGWPGVLAFRDGRLYALVVLQTREGLINDIHAIRNPQTLALLSGIVGSRL